ncbi:ABC transporter permease [Corynebacterium aquilae]|uniref:ABC3 transporter permease C-terminal domain-containing protein n=1 Tax=Corynebacterium aquilae DSM 44791 TaxID=1431546 RepID=A0A1L7CEP7_9CORY|nr:FtsX family ABC transporter permease [Corynebacterium aquilae]APT84319.1 hypothetical protein CAQU_03700 [Corynebacterium aquilae DSM 44791]
MRTLLLSNITSHSRRYVATGIAVAISAMFVFAALIFSSALNHSLTKGITNTYENVSAVASINDDVLEAARNGEDGQKYPFDAAEVEDFLQHQPGVAGVYRETFSSAFIRTSGNSILNVKYVPPTPFYRPSLDSGQWPSNNTEVALPHDYLEAWDLHVGDRVFLEPLTSVAEQPLVELTISGSYQSAKGRINGPYITHELYNQVFPGEETSNFFIAAASPDDTAHAQQDFVSRLRAEVDSSDAPVARAIAQSMTVLTGVDAMQVDLDRIESQRAAASAVLLVFPLITIFVAIIVIASSFRVLLQQRRKELALLRSLGATRRQVRRLLLWEAAVLGVVAATIGVVCAAVIGVVGLKSTGYADSFGEAWGSVNPLDAVAVLAGAVAVTVLVGVRPAAGSARISPMAALAQAHIDSQPPAAGRKNILFGGILIAVGVAAMALGLTVFAGENKGFVVAVLGGLVSLLGVLAIASTTLWRVTGLVGAPFKAVIPQLAVANTARNPHRTAATGTASIIGITLIVLLSVGAASTKQTLMSEIDYKRPYDLVVADSGRVIGDDTVTALRKAAGIAAVAGVHTAPVEVSAHSGGTPTMMTAWAASDLDDAVHAPIPQPRNGEVVVSQGFAEGERVTVCPAEAATDRCHTLYAKIYPRLGDSVMLLTEADARAIVPDITTNVAVVKLAEGARADKTSAAIHEIVPSASVSGSAQEREAYIEMIDQAFSVVAVLVAISVLVALVGLANTLSLSVLERTHENGLLRALGLRRKDMQKMLLVEAVLINSTGLLVGLLLGTVYGIVGSYALPVEVHAHHISIPWLIIASVVLISTLAAVLSSIVPGRRAARVSPTQALAAE